MSDIWTFHSAGSLVFGVGSSQQLGERVGELMRAKAKVLICTDRHLVAAEIADQVQRPLAKAGHEVVLFDRGQPEPAISLAEEAIDFARDCRPDVVLGLGGGSNMDLSKIVAACLTHGGGPRDYIGDCRIPGPVAPLVCVPTTSGTGSEVTAACVLTDTQRQMKVGILSNYLRPALAVVDPRLTLSCPAKVTADSGIDALTHAIEAYTAIDNENFPLPQGEKTVYQGRHPLGECLAEKAIELVAMHLDTAVKNPQDLQARTGMSLAATLAGLAFSNVGVALVHAMEYSVGGAVHCSHGAGNGLLLPYVMRFNAPECLLQMRGVGEQLGVEVWDMSLEEAAEATIEAVSELRRRIGIPGRLRDLGVTEAMLPGFAEKAFAVKRILRVNPRPVTQEDIESIYRAAL